MIGWSFLRVLMIILFTWIRFWKKPAKHAYRCPRQSVVLDIRRPSYWDIHKVGINGYRMDMAKVEGMCKWPQPKTLTEVSQFLGMVQYYRRYIPNMSAVLSPLNHWKKKNVVFIWGSEQEKSFQECKEWLMRMLF